MSTPKVNAAATALSAFRALPNGDGRQYTTVTAESGNRAVRMMINRFHKLGYLTSDWDSCYAVLDLLDDHDDIVQDFPIRDAAAFRYIKRVTHMQVAHAPSEPAS